MTYSPVGGCRCFGSICCFHCKGRSEPIWDQNCCKRRVGDGVGNIREAVQGQLVGKVYV